MTDPLRPPGKTPRRAGPLQPDRPGRATESHSSNEDATSDGTGGHEDPVDKQLEQSQTALDNVRNP